MIILVLIINLQKGLLSLSRIFIILLSLTFLITPITPISITNAAQENVVETKVYPYKDQKYVQITGGDQNVRNKINKILKIHAVNAAQENATLKKQQSHYYRTSTVETKYNAKELLSVVYKDSYYKGGVHGYEEATTYNFDLKTGTQLFLNNVVKTNKQAFHLFEGIEFALQANKNVFAEKARNFPLINKSNFYFYNEGIGVIFNPYEVGSYVAGFIEVKVPYSKIQSESGMFLDINKNFAAELQHGKLPGFNSISFGQTKAQVMETLNARKGESYYEMGSLFWYFEELDYISFHFGEGATDSLSHIQFSSKSFPMKTFSDVEKILGKGEKTESSNYDKVKILSYDFGDVHVDFESSLENTTISGINIWKK